MPFHPRNVVFRLRYKLGMNSIRAIYPKGRARRHPEDTRCVDWGSSLIQPFVIAGKHATFEKDG
jgi:hypothetical protein